MTVEPALLKEIPFLKGLLPTEMEAVKPLFFEKTLRRSEMVFLEGEPADTLFVLVNGVVKVFKTSANGKEQIISISVPHEVLNDTSIFDGGANPVAAQAMSTQVTLYGIKKDKLEQLLKLYPKVTLSIIKLLSERSRALLTLIEDLSFKHVIGRVGKILLEHTSGDGKQRLTQQEMAAIAGTAREVVARSLRTLEERGVVKIDRHRILITNKPALEKMILESS